MSTYTTSFQSIRQISSWDAIQPTNTSGGLSLDKMAMPIPPPPPKRPCPGQIYTPPHIPPVPPTPERSKSSDSPSYKPYQKSVCLERLAQQRQQATQHMQSWLKHTEDPRFSYAQKHEICQKFLRLLQCLS